MTKGGKQEVAAVGHNSYAGTRFNAVKHAVLSRYTVLPWEDAGEYEGLFSASNSHIEMPMLERLGRETTLEIERLVKVQAQIVEIDRIERLMPKKYRQ